MHANKHFHTLTQKKQQPWPFSRETQADKRFPKEGRADSFRAPEGLWVSSASCHRPRTCPISAPLPLLRCRSLAGAHTIVQTRIWNLSKNSTGDFKWVRHHSDFFRLLSEKQNRSRWQILPLKDHLPLKVKSGTSLSCQLQNDNDGYNDDYIAGAFSLRRRGRKCHAPQKYEWENYCRSKNQIEWNRRRNSVLFF